LSGLFLHITNFTPDSPERRATTINDMNHPFLTILAIVLMAPFTVLVVALNMKRSNERYLRKLKQRADKKQNRKQQ
jgi:hypothetical protein